MRRNPYVITVTVLAAAVFLIPGAWAFFFPRSFYETVADFPPFNLHLFHDVGAFQLGLGAAVLAALFWSDALFVALAGASVGMVVHAISHWLDKDLGGRPIDPWALSLLAVLTVAALVLRVRARPRRAAAGDRLAERGR